MFGAIAKGVVEGSLGRILDKLIPDREGRKAAEREFLHLVETGLQAEQAAQAEAQQAQLRINAAEAVHRSMFVAGWRPAVGWICTIGLGLMYLVFPIADWGLQMAGRDMTLPEISEQNIMGLLVPILGIGAYRTIEKIKGNAK